jgi:ribonuclease P protein component
MRRRADFTAAVRSGRRASSPSLVLHVVRRQETADPARVGLIVSKTVGGSVIRHQVARRIRAVCAGRIEDFTAGDLVVIRALPDAARATSAQLAADLEQALARLARRGPTSLGAAS